MSSEKTKIAVTITKAQNYIVCHDDCTFSRSCAIHHTAGDFRNEGGFRPKLLHQQTENGLDIYCCTRNEELDEEATRLYRECMPLGHEDLDQGEVTLMEIPPLNESEGEIYVVEVVARLKVFVSLPGGQAASESYSKHRAEEIIMNRFDDLPTVSVIDVDPQRARPTSEQER